MRKFLALALLASTTILSVHAQDSDLSIPNEKWVAAFKNYNCAAFGPAVAAPSAFTDLKVNFEKITTDSTLDNGLLKASFEVEGKICRYSAILFADNALATIRLVESKAFAPAQDTDCAEGKSVIDAALESNNYLYWGHPHNLTIMVPVSGVEAVCAGSSVMGVNFVVTGRIQK